MKKRKKSLNILGKPYSIEYMDNPITVDIHKREALFGQVDYWTDTIRILVKNRTFEDIEETLLHEILHVINVELELKMEEHTLKILGLNLYDTLQRNKLLKE